MKVLNGVVVLVVAILLVACHERGVEEKGPDKTIAEKVDDNLKDTTVVYDSARYHVINDKIVENPNDPQNYYDRGYYYFFNSRFEKAINDMNTAIKIDSNNAEYHYARGVMLQSAVKLEEAEKSFKKALEINPNLKEAHLFIAKTHFALKNYKIARQRVSEALKVDVHYAEAYFLRGMIYEEIGDSGAALSSFKTATEQDPEYFSAFNSMGVLYAAAHNDKAIQAYNTAISIEPYTGRGKQARYNLGVFYQQEERFEEAYETYIQLINVDSLYSLAYYNIGYMMLYNDTSYQEATEYFMKSVYFQPGSYLASAYLHIGYANELQYKYDLARKYYREALEVDDQFDLAAKSLNRVLNKK